MILILLLISTFFSSFVIADTKTINVTPRENYVLEYIIPSEYPEYNGLDKNVLWCNMVIDQILDTKLINGTNWKCPTQDIILYGNVNRQVQLYITKQAVSYNIANGEWEIINETIINEQKYVYNVLTETEPNYETLKVSIVTYIKNFLCSLTLGWFC